MSSKYDKQPSQTLFIERHKTYAYIPIVNENNLYNNHLVILWSGSQHSTAWAWLRQ
ncbi:hypothetical protein CERSUDRAFT_86178 [Gelatoporia subvermispora B]|uniref:Uncharacterized protein n=1 Tax=Ceriporiopsis subvermispora (strain B) TaxID=914234 RepID=M2QCK5_CERS8|nr:hypothetical protein CERSUDRAFT_86178 [Gelatoporia subvermispora B]